MSLKDYGYYYCFGLDLDNSENVLAKTLLRVYGELFQLKKSNIFTVQ